jgi:hypothetical protein
MSLLNKQIVCISTHYWNDPWFRKQHFMSRFAKKGYKVAYIEPTFSIVKKPDTYKSGYQTNRPFKVTVERKNDNLFIIKPPQGMPFWSHPIVSRLNYIYFAVRLRWVLNRLGFRDYILWNYRPEYAPGVSLFDYGKLVFDLTDDLAAYRGKENSKYRHIKRCMEYMVSKSDLVIVTASTLYEKYKDFSKKISLIPNGYESKLFSGNIGEIPHDMQAIKSPVIGFIGTLFSFLDYDLLEHIIKNNPDKSFVFIGHLEENARKAWEEIRKYNNVFWLGKKKKEDIPSYLGNFDVCINPFKVDDVSRSVSPLKVFEYLAMKKPVVSVRMESLEKEEVARFIYFAASYEEFNREINAAVREKEMFGESDYRIIQQYSWDKLFEKVSHLIENL